MWHRCKNNCAFLPSRLARALWIEITNFMPALYMASVEARESPVDRNFSITPLKCILKVEARESPVDRNLRADTSYHHVQLSRLARALWIEIGSNMARRTSSSPSRLARALWIEITGRFSFAIKQTSRGSREPCGSKLFSV